MDVDLNKKHFLISFKFSKCHPKDFGLIQSCFDSNIYINPKDHSQWVKQETYDFGWGNENGFMRLPKLQFEELWYLLTNSKIQENKYGAAYIIEQQFSDELLKLLIEIFSRNSTFPKEIIEAFKILKLHEAKNRSPILGKLIGEIHLDDDNWKYISEKVKKIPDYKR